jgi:hypothetical protein
LRYSSRIFVSTAAQDLEVVLAVARRLLPGVVPGDHAPGVGERAVVLREQVGGQAEHLGLDRRRVDLVGTSPWPRQNSEVSVFIGSMTTRNFSFDSAAIDFLTFGRKNSGL